MKKIIFLSLICLLVFFGTISAMAISEGDCIVAGEYNGNPIIWRCADVSDDGIYLISENVLFNQKYNSESSSLWSTSEIRSYLNKEFLKDCLGKESVYIIEKDIQTISATSNDSQQHIYNNGFEYAVQNAENSYTITTKDKIFLPSIEEVQTLYKNIALYGSDFYMGKDFNGNYVDYYLRDSVSFDNMAKYVRCVSSDIDIYYISGESRALGTYYDRLIRSVPVNTEGIGIRPAFYISADTPLINGDGSINNPYEIPGSCFAEVRFDKNVYFQGTYIVPDILYSFSEEGQYIKYYCNNRQYDLNDECMIGYGDNTFYAVVYNQSGEEIYVSEERTAIGFSLDPGTNRLFMDFEGEKPLSGFDGGYKAEKGDVLDVVDVGGEHKNVLHFDAHTSGTFANTQSFKNYKNLVIIESDIMLLDWNFTSRPVLYIAVYKGTSKLWLTPLVIKPDGRLIFDDGSGTNVIRDDIKLNEWYKFTLVYDVSKNTVSLLLDDEIYIYNSSVPLSFDYIGYINLGYATPSENSEMYFDNLRVATSKQEMTGSRYGIPYYNTRDVKIYDFSSDNTSFTIPAGVTQTDASFSKIEEYDDIRGMVGHVKTSGTDSKRSLATPYADRKIFSSDVVSDRLDAWVMEFEFNVTQCDKDITLLGALSYRNENNTEKTWCPLYFNNKGELYISKNIDCQGFEAESNVKVKEFSLNNWHKVRYMIDTKKLIIYIYFDEILYAEVDCGRSKYTGATEDRVFSVENSSKSCYFEIQANSPDKEGLANEFYVDNIAVKAAKSPVVYNVEYINNGKRIYKKEQIKDFSSLKIKADILSDADIKAITSAILSTGELDSLIITDVVEQKQGFSSAEMELKNISTEIQNGEITTMFWIFDTMTPVSDVVKFN